MQPSSANAKYLLLVTVAILALPALNHSVISLNNGVIFMTAKPPSASSLTPDTPTGTTATVTFTEIRDSLGQPVDQNTTTYDKTLTGEGTAGSDTELWLRDQATRFDEVTSGSTGSWIKTFTLSAFKRYRLNAIEKSGAQDFSRTMTFVLATETPIINRVVGNDGPIESGDTYYGDSVEITGNAPPGVIVTAFNGADSLGMAPVNADGLFELPIDDLTAKTYNIRIRTPDDKESATFVLIVASDGEELSLDDVLESEAGPSIPEGGTTYKDKLIIQGHAKTGATVQLLNNDSPIEDATAPADPIDGEWKIPLDVTAGPYSLTAEALGEKTSPPRTFTVASTERPQITHVTDSDGPIDDNGDTRFNFVVVRGNAAALKGIKIKINGVISDQLEPTDDVGKWARLVTGLQRGTEYQFIAVADYDDKPESDPWTINVLASGNATED
jgi:hypothetical protein